MRSVRFLAALVVLGLSLTPLGCGKKTEKPSPGRASPKGAADTGRRGPPEHKSRAPSPSLSGPAEKLVSAVETALKTNQLGPVLQLLPTAETVQGCPQLTADAAKTWGSFDKAVAHTRQRTREELTRCHNLGNWSTALRVEVREHRPASRPVLGCRRLLVKGRIELTYRLGTKTVVVELPAPAIVDGKTYVLLDGVRCRPPLK
ncbi:MAG: hypothetical protein ABI333_22795 [bacterium]